MDYLPHVRTDPHAPPWHLRLPTAPRSAAPTPGYQAVPVELVAALDGLPFDVHVRRHDHMVLYATRGADPFAISVHAREGLELYVEAADADELRGALLGSLVKTLGHGYGPPPSGSDAARERFRGVMTFALALLAPCYAPEGGSSPVAFSSALRAVDLLTHALVEDPALRNQILRLDPALLSEAAALPRPERSRYRRVPLGGHARPASRREPSARTGVPWVDPTLPVRGIVVLAMALALASAIGVPSGARLLDLGRGAALLDLGMAHLALASPGRSGHAALDRYRRRRHVLVGPEIVERVLGERPRFGRFLAGHHERVDGSGYPRAIAGSALDPEVALVGLADAAVALIAPRTGGAMSWSAALKIAPIAFRGRFADDLLLALVAVLDGERYGRERQPIVLA